MDFKERKQKRKEHFEKNIKGWKQRPCTACNGSGYYDHNGSPKCGSCNGTGKEMYKPNPQLNIPVVTSGVLFSRVWEMPNSNTFDIKCIGKLIHK